MSIRKRDIYGRSPFGPLSRPRLVEYTPLCSFQRSKSMNSVLLSCEHEELRKLSDNLYECKKCGKTFDINISCSFSRISPPVYQDVHFIKESLDADLEFAKPSRCTFEDVFKIEKEELAQTDDHILFPFATKKEI